MAKSLFKVAWKQSQDDQWNLLYLNTKLLRYIYCDRDYWGDEAMHWPSVEARRKIIKRLVKEGKLPMPKRQEEYRDPDAERTRVRKLRERTAPKVGGAAIKQLVSIQVPEEHVPFHEKLQEALDEEGRVTKAIISGGEWTGFIKNSDNEIEYTNPLKSKRIKFEVDFDTEPKWPPVNRVESVKLPKREQKEADRLRASKRAVVLSDLQIPYQDENAIKVALEVLRDVKPDRVILVGDLLDLAPMGKYAQRPEFATQTQGAIQQAHELLAMIRKLAPTAEIDVLAGNHDQRMEKHIQSNAMAAFGLRRADQPEGWPVLSVPYLTAMDSLDINYHAGYPANRVWINQNLQVRHGNIARKGNTAVVVAQEERASTIFGHVHRLETQYLTYHHYEGGKTVGAWSIGCLCKIMGEVPSTKSGHDLSGNPIPNAENWQQAFAVVDYEEGDGGFQVTPIYINTFDSYRAIYGGRVYEA